VADDLELESDDRDAVWGDDDYETDDDTWADLADDGRRMETVTAFAEQGLL